MDITDISGFTLRSVNSHRLRSGLTALGIAVGVAAVVLLTSLGEGLHQFMINQFSQFGTNTIAINPGRPATFGMSPGVVNTVRPLTIDDGEALARLPQVSAWIPARSGLAEIEANGRQRQVTVFGVGADGPAFFGYSPAIGEFLPDDDPTSARPFVVLGSELRKQMYGDLNPLGDRIRIGGSRFRVIGVMEEKGNFLGFDLDDLVFIPASRALELFNENGLQEIDIQYHEGLDVDEVVNAVTRLLVARHGHEDFSITTQQQMTEVLGSVLSVLQLGVAALGSISLLVGGVGIFTIMTIAVRERTSEIGLLRAVGSTKDQIHWLFLSESILLGALGGLFGLLVGIAGAVILGLVVPSMPVTLSVPYAVGAELIAIAIGLLAGVLPARRAAELDPLEALRTE